MRRRIVAAIVGTTAVVLVVLSVPLAIAARNLILNAEVLKLRNVAAHTLTEIQLPIDLAQVERLGQEPDAPPPFSVYSPDGARLLGAGPSHADATVDSALAGQTVSDTTGSSIVVVAPIVEPQTENVIGALRVSRSMRDVDRKTGAAILVIVSAGALALVAAWLGSRRLAVRLSSPLERLAADATHIGDSDRSFEHEPTGITEIDQLGATIATTNERIHQAIARERQFSDDVSHQLRTPLTGLRLKLESVADDESGHIATALDDLERLEATVAHLLQFARDATPSSETAELDELVDRGLARWAGQIEHAARSIRHERIAAHAPVVVAASAASIEQILDVLIENALRHGRGEILLRTRRLTGGGALDVSDQGSAPEVSDDDMFRRGYGTGTGIGLALARSLADGEGGRLLRVRVDPTTFSLVFVAPSDGS